MNHVFHTARIWLLFVFPVGTSAFGPVWSADLADVYNQGVNQYQQSEFDDAAAFFKRAAASSDDEVAARSRYNLGNSLYAKATNLIRKSRQDPARLDDAGESKLQGLPPNEPQSGQEASPIELLEDAVEAYRSSLRLNPNDEDARFNLENATRLVDQLKQQSSDQNSPPNDDKPDSEQNSDQKKDSSEQQQSDEGSREKPEDRPEKDEEQPKQDSEQQENQNDKAEGEKDAEEKREEAGEEQNKQKADPEEGKDGDELDEKGANQSQEPGQPQDSDQESEEREQTGQAPAGNGSPSQPSAARQMTAQEAKKMLQAIRDRDMQRRQHLEALKRSRRVVVPRDW